MIAIRVQRLLVFVLAAASILSLLSPRSVPAQAGKEEGFATILFDSATATPVRFSPNGDGVLDSVAVGFTLPDTADIFVYVSPPGQTDTVRVLFTPRTLLPGVQHRAVWFGEDETGLVQPEGLYTVRFLGLARSGRQLANLRQVELDLTPPTPQILQVQPGAYTPTLPGNDALPTVSVRVSRSRLGDRVAVNVLDSLRLRVGTLELAGEFGGDGDYLFLCDVCADSLLEDGLVFLQAFGQDEAGNDSTVVDSLDKNIAGPAVMLQHPEPLSVQHADSLVGLGSDRQPVASMWLRFTVPPDTLDTTFDLPPRGGVAGKTYPFFFDLSPLLMEEGEYPLTIGGTDADGVSQETEFLLRVDRSPPPSPRPDPPLPEVVRSSTLSATVAVDGSETEVLVVSGGIGEPDSIAAQSRDLILFTRTLVTGSNTLRFEAIDLAGNVSAPTTVSITYDLSVGLFAPERFRAGDRIELNAGDSAAQGVVVQILAMDGSLVRIFEDRSSRRQYAFPWDLRTPEGREVRNGAYLVVARLRRSSGEERLRTMIAVVR